MFGPVQCVPVFPGGACCSARDFVRVGGGTDDDAGVVEDIAEKILE